MMSLWPTVMVPDFGARCIEVYGKCIAKQLKTQHLNVVWPLMKKCLDIIKEHTSEDRLMLHEFICYWSPNTKHDYRHHNLQGSTRLSRIKVLICKWIVLWDCYKICILSSLASFYFDQRLFYTVWQG